MNAIERDAAVTALERLAAELDPSELVTTLVAGDNRVPCLGVASVTRSSAKPSTPWTAALRWSGAEWARQPYRARFAADSPRPSSEPAGYGLIRVRAPAANAGSLG